MSLEQVPVSSTAVLCSEASKAWSGERPKSERPAPRLLDRVREQIRYLHYSLRTEHAYVHWIKAFIHFHGLRHPASMGAGEVEAFLSHLANQQRVAASTHRQALSALVFLYRQVLQQELPWMNELGRPKVSQRLPVVLSPDEVARLLALLPVEHRLFGQLLYGTGLRLMEALRLRVKDLEFNRQTLIVRSGKGDKDRAVMLPKTLIPALSEQLKHCQALWRADDLADLPGVFLPHALERKYPRAPRSWPWYWVFPQDKVSKCPRTGAVRRHHTHEQSFQRAFKRAVERAGIAKPAQLCRRASGGTCGPGVRPRAAGLRCATGQILRAFPGSGGPGLRSGNR